MSIIRDDTKEKYVKALTELAKTPKPMFLGDMAAHYKLDLKLPSFMKSKGWLVETIVDSKLYIAKYNLIDVEGLLDAYFIYRNEIDSKAAQDRKDLKYYQENKAFLVDKRTFNYPQMTVETVNSIKEETKVALIKEVVEYAAMAVKLGKTDIVGFITTLLNTK